VEDVLVTGQKPKGNIEIKIKDFIEARGIPIWKGSPDQLFDKLLKWTPNGSGYISNSNGLPKNSVGFWICDKSLSRVSAFGKIRYEYPDANNNRGMVYKGVDKHIKVIPAGTLLRVSLAKWMSFAGDDEPKCWLQLSGWYDL